MNSRIPIILDCDPNHDDVIAIILALASPELYVLGISTSAGGASFWVLNGREGSRPAGS